MIALYIILSIFILLFLAAMLPLSLTLTYKDEVTLYASVWAVKFKLYPKAKKALKSQKKPDRKKVKKKKNKARIHSAQ